MAKASKTRFAIAAGLLVLMLSMHLGNWVGYALCKASKFEITDSVLNCDCEAYLTSLNAFAGQDSFMGNNNFKVANLEGMPAAECWELPLYSAHTQRGLQPPSSPYTDPYAEDLFHPPAKSC
jgi:hypothetical protein